MIDYDFVSNLYAGMSGYMYLWTKPDKKSYPFPVTDAAGINQKARELSSSHHDVYCSIGVRPQPVTSDTRGTQQSISQIGCLWADIDICDPAAHKSDRLPRTIEDALSILPADYPPSLIVSSGHGLHVYWMLSHPVDITDTNRAEVIQTVKKIQQLIRNTAGAHNWEVDPTADLTRVLRVPSTWNYKDPHEAVLCEIIDASDTRYDYETFRALSVPVPELKIDRGKGFQRNPADGPASYMLQNCKFLQHCHLDAQTLTYDEWVAALSNLARASDGSAACHELSKADSVRYDPSVTDQKIDEVLSNMSPRTCEYIQHTLGFTHCDDCQVKCPAHWSLEHVHRAIATVNALSNPTPETVFTDAVIGSLALLEKESPVHYQRFKGRLKSAGISVSDLTKTIAAYRRKSFHAVDAPEQAPDKKPGVKTTQQMLPDCPIDLRIPAGFAIDATGINEFRERMDGSTIVNPAAGVPVVITARIYNIDTDTEKIEICFRYFNRWIRTVQIRSTVFSSRSIVHLADCGLSVSSETAKYLVKYLQQLESINQDRIPLQYSVSRLGWRKHGEEFIIPSGTNYRIEMDDEGDITDAMTPAGTMPGWMQTAGVIRQHTFARFLLAASFASPLLGLFRQRNFLLYFWGTSGGGKTAAMKMALSAWGNPDGLMTSFLTTKAGLERRLSLLSDFPVAINERQVAGQGRDKQDYLEYVVYMLEGGKGKGRATKTGLQKTAWWRTIGMANGEEPLSRENSVRGVKNRILEINTYPVIPDDLAKQIHQMTDWGHAGPEFIQHLLQDKPAAGEVWNTIRQELSGHYADYSPVHVDAVSVIITADVLESMWLFGIPQQEAIRQALYMAGEVFRALPTAHDISDVERAWDFVTNWIAANDARFDDEMHPSSRLPTPLYGFIRSGRTCIFPAELRRAMEDEGLSYDKLVREFGAAGKIEQTPDTQGKLRTSQVIRYGGRLCRVIIVTTVTQMLPPIMT